MFGWNRKKESATYRENEQYEVSWWTDRGKHRTIQGYFSYEEAYDEYDKRRCQGFYGVRLTKTMEEYSKHIR